MPAAIHRFTCAAVLALMMPCAFAQVEPLRAQRLTPDELIWGISASGNQQANVAGDLSRPGIYGFRSKFRADARLPPHFHNDERINTVISGTLYVGFGEQFDESRLKALPAGSVWIEPANQPHYSWAKDGEVIFQVIGVGPSVSTPVKPKQ